MWSGMKCRCVGRTRACSMTIWEMPRGSWSLMREEAKVELGIDHHEIRKYPGWHHHMLTCLLTHFFLWHMKIRLGEKAPALTVSQLRRFLERVLPLKTYTIAEALWLVARVQQRHHRAFLSHRKRRHPEPHVK